MPYPALEAVGTRRVIDTAGLDRPAVFVCYAEATQGGANAIEEAVRQQYSAAQVLVAHVIDLHTVPGMFHAIARNILNSEYEKAVAALPAGEDAAAYVIILPDWDAAFVKSLGLEDVTKHLGVAVLDSDGNLLGLGQDEALSDTTLRLLETVPGLIPPVH
jgi:hypothetical protein